MQHDPTIEEGVAQMLGANPRTGDLSGVRLLTIHRSLAIIPGYVVLSVVFFQTVPIPRVCELHSRSANSYNESHG